MVNTPKKGWEKSWVSFPFSAGKGCYFGFGALCALKRLAGSCIQKHVPSIPEKTLFVSRSFSLVAIRTICPLFKDWPTVEHCVHACSRQNRYNCTRGRRKEKNVLIKNVTAEFGRTVRIRSQSISNSCVPYMVERFYKIL